MPYSLQQCELCESHEVHVNYMPALEEAAERLLQADPLTPGSCTRALSWLASDPSPSSCPRLLLSIREILKRHPVGFADNYQDHYPIAYGRLIGTLIERISNDPTLQPDLTAQNLQKSLWADLYDPFIDATTWKARRPILNTAKAVIRQISDCGRHDEFWHILELYASYVSAAYENPIPPDKELRSAGRVYLDLLFSLFHPKSSHASNRGPRPRKATDAVLLARTSRLALLIAIRTADDLVKWATTIPALRQVVAGYQHTEIEQEFAQCAEELHRHAYSSRDISVRRGFEGGLEIAMPVLHRRVVAPNRTKPFSSDSHCTVRFHNGVCVRGNVINICTRSCRGFAVETTEAEIVAGPAPGIVSIRTDSQSGRTPSLEGPPAVFSAEEGPAALTIHLTGEQRAPVFRNCNVVRKWPLDRSRRGLGFALVDNLSDINDSWREYVAGLSTKGRYDAGSY
jgi:hypothetical protein